MSIMSEDKITKKEEKYDSSQIQKLEGLGAGKETKCPTIKLKNWKDGNNGDDQKFGESQKLYTGSRTQTIGADLLSMVIL